jgi:hypothetical protein
MDFTYFSQCLLLYARELYIKHLDLQSHLPNAKFVFWQFSRRGTLFSHDAIAAKYNNHTKSNNVRN